MDNNVPENPGAIYGTYQAEFESIRAKTRSDLQELASKHVMTVRQMVNTCINTNAQIANLAQLHAKQIEEKFRQHTDTQLINYTNSNAMFNVNGHQLLATFDLNQPGVCIQSAKFIHPMSFHGQAEVQDTLLAIRMLQILMMTPIDDTHIVIPYQQLANAKYNAKHELQKSKDMLSQTILARAMTAFDFEPGLSFYTVNHSDNMDMLFWDRYTITQSTAKSYYVEQHCIVEHTITGDIEPERYIALHKPSKNSMPMFLAERLACLTELVRPEPTVELPAEAQTEVPVVETTADDDEDERWTRAELIEQGIDPDTVDPSNIKD